MAFTEPFSWNVANMLGGTSPCLTWEFCGALDAVVEMLPDEFGWMGCGLGWMAQNCFLGGGLGG